MSDKTEWEKIKGTHGSLSEDVYHSFRSRIISGSLPAGTLLSREDMLSGELGVSRTVLREALARLRHDGLIESKKGTGSRVLQYQQPTIFQITPLHSIAELQACYEFRYGVEPDIAALAAERADELEIRRIENCAREMEAVVSSGNLGAEQDLAFHAAIATAAKNAYYIQTIAAIAGPVEVGLRVASALTPAPSHERLSATISEHQAIVDAIRNGDPAAARDAMQRHIKASRERVFIGT